MKTEGIMTPTRRRSRADERAARIRHGRSINEARLAAEAAEYAARIAPCNDPSAL